MAEEPAASAHYRAVVEYDGTDLLGFQRQAQGRTVQGELEQALHDLTQHFVRVVGSGRTDSGVHAKGQVIAFKTPWAHSLADMHRALNALLPPDIAVQSIELAPPDFHPRFSALKRWYRYQVGCWPYRSPLRSRYAWELGRTPEIKTMNVAAAHLLGEHDFAGFGRPPQGDNTVRRVFSARWTQQDSYLYFDIIANAFLRRMVRNIVGALVQVGLGRRSPQDVAAHLTTPSPSLLASPAPPQGLFLMAVTYLNDEEPNPNASSNNPSPKGMRGPGKELVQ